MNELGEGYGPERFNLVFKFEEEARFMFGVSTIKVKDDQSCLTTKGVRCPLFNYTGKNIVGMGKWEKMVSQAIKDAKENGGTYWISKLPRPTGKEIFELDDLKNLPRVGKKTMALLNNIGFFTMKDCIDKRDQLQNSIASLPVSDG